MRKSGVLMHISSLPSDYGCGSFGIPAYKFVDLLADSNFKIWQTLPLGWPDEYGSPYKAVSAFAGNPYFIDLPTLCHDGLLTKEELASAAQDTPYICEFERLAKERIPLLRLAASRVQNRTEIENFVMENKNLDGFCVYMATKDANNGKAWWEFDPEIKADPDELFMHRFIQYTFFDQWFKLKSYANSRGIEIIGDIPIYTDLDSADVYIATENFLVDKKTGRPEAVAGVPPDYFAEDGQLWGNPLYNWKYMKSDGYSWWKERIKWQTTIFDGVRIDHFRAFSAYWAVPYGAKTAKEGKWIKGPGLPFVKEMIKTAGSAQIIAEDLGDIDEGVHNLLVKSGLPGMRVFQFAFLEEDSTHQPHNYIENCIAYSGTHDNNTLLGYVWESDDNVKHKMCDYVGHPYANWGDICPDIMKVLLRSCADRVIFPIQDVLGYGSDTRMNKPGTTKENWSFRVTEEQLNSIDRAYWNYTTKLFGR